MVWRHKWVSILALEQDRLKILDSLRELVGRLQRVAEDRFSHAYMLGFQSGRLTQEGDRKLADTLHRNEEFLSESLAPSLLEQLTMLDEWFEEGIAALLLAQRYHVVKYTQPYWELIWSGLGERFRIAEGAGLVRGIKWHLDPGARHCGTCPPKEGKYGSWVEFVQTCGGVPGSFEANDECGPGCRCWLEIEWV